MRHSPRSQCSAARIADDRCAHRELFLARTTTAAPIEMRGSHLTVPFLRSSSAARSAVGKTRFAHAAVLRPVPTECPECADRAIKLVIAFAVAQAFRPHECNGDN